MLTCTYSKLPQVPTYRLSPLAYATACLGPRPPPAPGACSLSSPHTRTVSCTGSQIRTVFLLRRNTPNCTSTPWHSIKEWGVILIQTRCNEEEIVPMQLFPPFLSIAPSISVNGFPITRPCNPISPLSPLLLDLERPCCHSRLPHALQPCTTCLPLHPLQNTLPCLTWMLAPD
jgi:hypothetical protein